MPTEDQIMETVRQVLPRYLNDVVAAKSLVADAARSQPMLEVNATTAFDWTTSETAIDWDSKVRSRLFDVTTGTSITIPQSGWYAVTVQAKVARAGSYYILRAYKDSITAANELLRDARGAIATIAHAPTLSGEVYLEKGEALVISRQASSTYAADVGVESNGSGHTRLTIRRVSA